MHRYKNLTVIGTSHIALQSIKEVEKIILKQRPAIIALELDKKRFSALQKKEKRLSLKSIKKLGLAAFLINLIGAWVEKQLAKQVKTSPGAEMKKAIALAKKYKIKIALIDQDINITLKKLVKTITFKEKLRFIIDIIKNFFSFKKVRINLKKVPSERLINSMIAQVKKRYPSLYQVLVKERNKILAQNLYKLMTLYPNKRTVAVVGAGHEKAILGDLKLKFKKMNLRQ